MNVINYVISKKEKKTIFVNWDVCVNNCTVQWVYILISERFKDFRPNECILQISFFLNPKSDSIWNFKVGKDFHVRIKQAHVF